ncbi:hypothetical protein [Amycolatopsis australiensis]|nr:hypothetical protein [Amycolatopsis australiensis]
MDANRILAVAARITATATPTTTTVPARPETNAFRRRAAPESGSG